VKFGGLQLRTYVLPIGVILKEVTKRMRKRQLIYGFLVKRRTTFSEREDLQGKKDEASPTVTFTYTLSTKLLSKYIKKPLIFS
jgi:hypothetical protein